MQWNLAHKCHGIRESKAKYVPRSIAGEVVHKKQGGSPNSRIRVTRCGYLDGLDGYLAAETCSPLLRNRTPSTDEIVCDFKVRPCHDGRNNPDRFAQLQSLKIRRRLAKNSTRPPVYRVAWMAAVKRLRQAGCHDEKEGAEYVGVGGCGHASFLLG